MHFSCSSSSSYKPTRVYNLKWSEVKTSTPQPQINSNSTTESTLEISIPEPEKTPVLPIFDFKEGTKSPWKFTREAPRLSFDSRAVVDVKGTMTIHPKEEEKWQCFRSKHKNRTSQKNNKTKEICIWLCWFFPWSECFGVSSVYRESIKFLILRRYFEIDYVLFSTV